jgi:hypothetical protein
MRCAICTRRMHGAVIRKHEVYYRCLARTLAPGSEALATHPRTVNVREFDLVEPINAWLGGLFAPGNVDRTVTALVDSQEGLRESNDHEAAAKRLKGAEARLRRFQDAIAAGIDPAAVVDAVNTAQAERAAARAELDGMPAPGAVTAAEVYAMVDASGDIGATLADAQPEHIGRLYQDLGLDLRFHPEERAVDVTASPRVVSVCVRGRSCTLSTRLSVEVGPR